MPPTRTETELGWPQILSSLADRCRSPFGRRRALALPFQPTASDAREALARVGEARSLSEMALSLPLGGVGEVEPLIDRAARGGVLEPLALRECAALVRAAARTREVLRARAAEAPRLWAVAEPLTERATLADRIERAIEPSGTVSERASPALAQARERARGLHRALKVQVEGLLGDPEMERHLRDRYFTIRNERYVLPVLASARSAVPGIVHNASQSGQTLFVEPDSMVELGNELSIANAVAQEEEQRILRELSEELGQASAALTTDLGALGALDVLEASARLASDLDAHPPEVAPVPAGFELLSLRHPLLVLQGKKVVASHVRLVPPERALIVSGPNGGGKTVAITAVGLSALMLRAGLPVAAAAGSRLPFFLEVQAAVDERGDLAKDLSTFTAHLAAVREMLAGAIPGSLVLVDEIAADTDPREGAALAAAILEALVEKGAAVLVTTHLDELKALALTDPRYANARVGFDAERLQPTYQLHLGTPGSSSAIEVAARVGLPPAVVERARSALGGQGGALGQALRARPRLGARRGRGAARRAAGEAVGEGGDRGAATARGLARDRGRRGAHRAGAGRDRARGGARGRGEAGHARPDRLARAGGRGRGGRRRQRARARGPAQGPPPDRGSPPTPREGEGRPAREEPRREAHRRGRRSAGRAAQRGDAARRPRAEGRGAAARGGAFPRSKVCGRGGGVPHPPWSRDRRVEAGASRPPLLLAVCGCLPERGPARGWRRRHRRHLPPVADSSSLVPDPLWAARPKPLTLHH